MQTGHPGGGDSERLRNPLRNERDAFRLLTQVFVGALAVVVVAALIDRTAALIVGAVLLALGAWRAARWLRAWLAMPEEERRRFDGVDR